MSSNIIIISERKNSFAKSPRRCDHVILLFGCSNIDLPGDHSYRRVRRSYMISREPMTSLHYAGDVACFTVNFRCTRQEYVNAFVDCMCTHYIDDLLPYESLRSYNTGHVIKFSYYYFILHPYKFAHLSLNFDNFVAFGLP